MRLTCRAVGVLRSSATAPVARANTVSPSARVWLGSSARASPAWAAEAVRLQSALSRTASVATTTRVVLSGGVLRDFAAAVACSLRADAAAGFHLLRRCAKREPQRIYDSYCPNDHPVL